MKKHVHWSSVTVYEFGVSIGGSAVPRRGGPSIGLAKKPTSVWSTPLECFDSEEESDLENQAMEEQEDLKAAQQTNKSPTTADGAYLKGSQCRRRRRVRWLRPFERVAMLTRAGCSEKRIHRVMKECSAIVMSRRLNLQTGIA